MESAYMRRDVSSFTLPRKPISDSERGDAENISSHASCRISPSRKKKGRRLISPLIASESDEVEGVKAKQTRPTHSLTYSPLRVR